MYEYLHSLLCSFCATFCMGTEKQLTFISFIHNRVCNRGQDKPPLKCSKMFVFIFFFLLILLSSSGLLFIYTQIKNTVDTIKFCIFFFLKKHYCTRLRRSFVKTQMYQIKDHCLGNINV